MPLSVDGRLGAARTDSLKYAPAVNPVYRRVNGHLLVIGMAHRGPTVILQLVTPDELKVFHSSKVATGRGFMSRHDPVLACKGDVVMLVGSKGPGAPVRTPDGFPGNKGIVTPHQGKLVAFWHVDVPSDEPTGMIQAAELGGRQGLNVRQVHQTRQILSLDAASTPRVFGLLGYSPALGRCPPMPIGCCGQTVILKSWIVKGRFLVLSVSRLMWK